MKTPMTKQPMTKQPMTKRKTFIAACALGLGLLTGGGATAHAADVAIGYIGRQEPPREPLSFVEPILEDEDFRAPSSPSRTTRRPAVCSGRTSPWTKSSSRKTAIPPQPPGSCWGAASS